MFVWTPADKQHDTVTVVCFSICSPFTVAKGSRRNHRDPESEAMALSEVTNEPK